MRKTSIVSMIIAGVIIIAGIIVCAVGGARAKQDNFMLFPEIENGESVYRHDFTEEDISRISITVDNAEVSFTRGGSSSYVEIRNFNANYYKLSVENNLISFTEVSDVMSMFKFWEGGFSFKGMRYIFRFDTDSDQGRRVIVNLAEGAEVPAVAIDAGDGAVKLSSLSLKTELSIDLAGGSAELNSFTLDGNFDISSDGGSLTVKDCVLPTFVISGESCTATVSGSESDLCQWEMKAGKVTAEKVTAGEFIMFTTEADVTASSLLADKITASSNSGQVILSLADALATHSAEITSKSGSIFVDGVHYTGSFSIPGSEESRHISITSDSASISLEGAE